MYSCNEHPWELIYSDLIIMEIIDRYIEWINTYNYFSYIMIAAYKYIYTVVPYILFYKKKGI